MRKFQVAAIQMIGPPAALCGGVNEFAFGGLTGARAVNAALSNGTAADGAEARRRIAAIDADAIMAHSVARMIDLLGQAASQGCRWAVFPELALTSFFPYLYIEDQSVLNRFFLSGDLRRTVVAPLFDVADRWNVNVVFGYAEAVGGRRLNTFVLYDTETKTTRQYHKTHLPGFEKPRPGEVSFQFEKGIFEASNEGYPVFSVQGGTYGMLICHDRRYSNPYLAMGMATGKNVEMIFNGYNTPFDLTFAQGAAQGRLDGRVYEFHYLPQQAQAITEGTYVASVAIAGDVFGANQIGGTCLIAPDGSLLAKEERLVESVLVAPVDLDLAREVRLQKYNGDRARPEVLLKELIRTVGPDTAAQLLNEVRAEGDDARTARFKP
jgi:predicted amidohydrolase